MKRLILDVKITFCNKIYHSSYVFFYCTESLSDQASARVRESCSAEDERVVQPRKREYF